jgi:voltage-gated potassium channel Kch
MTAEAVAVTATPRTGVPAPAEHQEQSSLYELFMGLMTIMSLVIMFLTLVVRNDDVDAILTGTDTLLCIMFLFDFARSLKVAPSKSAYLFGPRPGRTLPQGVLDLLSSIPSVGIFRFFRVFRLARVARILRARGAKSLAKEFLARRAESAIYIIAVLAMLVLVIGSSLIAFVEPDAEGANIEDGGDAFWWAFVTITTVGYGDRFPVTEGGRLVGMLTMAVGIGIFGVLTSYLSSLFMAPPETPGQDDAPGSPAEPPPDEVAAQLAAVRAELADLRRLLETRTSGPVG